MASLNDLKLQDEALDKASGGWSAPMDDPGKLAALSLQNGECLKCGTMRDCFASEGEFQMHIAQCFGAN